MATGDNNNQIIKDFLDLWQKQFATISRDPEFLASFMQDFFGKTIDIFNYPQPHSSKEHADTPTSSNLSVIIVNELKQLNSRIDEIERRIDKLESKPEPKGDKNKTKPRAA